MRAQLLLATAIVLGGATAGCFDILSNADDFRQGDGGSMGTGGTGGTGGTMTTSVAVECIPSGTSKAVDNTCGKFVSPNGNDDTGDGTQENPYATITKALAEGESIYVCAAAAKPYEEAVLIEKAGIYLFGGLDCTTWVYDAALKTPLTAKPGELPLHLRGKATLRIEDFAITAQDAPALMQGEYAAGKSSIGIVAEATTSLDMARCDVTAGKGGDGAPGEPPMGTAMAGPDGANGAKGCVGDTNNAGVDGGQNTCNGNDFSGGLSGTGTKTASGGNGSDGQPSGGPLGEAGLGQTSVVTCDQGGNGEDGQNGELGDPGIGAAASMLGNLSTTGIVGPGGADGASGKPGQGGGGGGGARMCQDGTAGPSGGGGGAGGCGGAGGKGGYAGGASIGILSLGATLLFENVKITTGAGGNGGAGASGQDGGAGGMGGMPGAGDANAIACPGGKGGTGGKGGRGGGGLGGHSIGIAHTGTAPSATADVVVGTPGVGGMGEGPDGNGASGIGEKVLAF